MCGFAACFSRKLSARVIFFFSSGAIRRQNSGTQIDIKTGPAGMEQLLETRRSQENKTLFGLFLYSLDSSNLNTKCATLAR
jgi:hypothetical protein